MKVFLRIAVAFALGVFGPGKARAEHAHGGGGHHHCHSCEMPEAAEPVTSTFRAGLGLVAARYDTQIYGGDYQGVVPAASWMRGRLGASAAIGLYRLVENGARRYGVSDVVLSGQATLVEGPRGAFGVALPLSLPTGNHATGFGMGHVMVMPGVWASGQFSGLQLGGSLGYSRALGGAEHHDHGSWPLVDPMNQQELTWSASAYVPLGNVIRTGLRMSGGVPLGEGRERVTGGVRAIWTEGRVETGFEIQAGFAGDPFILRGLVESAVQF